MTEYRRITNLPLLNVYVLAEPVRPTPEAREELENCLLSNLANAE